ncbi:uncharacterized protein LOC124136592 isoform X2 [Haliotis rufescens]|nr:uncharacterized protein LOC124136592 isoform X2 [Haliotis rufescens]XP_046358516.2 uncharacterized protein LOC124136592 isoform X2 [Haliotis rufescens]
MTYSHKNTSFDTQEVLQILHEPDWTRVIRQPPVKPRAGDVFLYHFTEESKKDDWKCDQYHFHHDGTRKQPKRNPKFNKTFFVIRTSHGKDSRFKKHAYILLGDSGNLVLFQYLGDHSVALDLPHGNSRDPAQIYTRLCPSVIRSIKNVSIRVKETFKQMEKDAGTSAAPMINKPRSLEQIRNIRFRERQKNKLKGKGKKKKKKKMLVKRNDNETEEQTPLLKDAIGDDNEQISTRDDSTDVQSPHNSDVSPNTQNKLLELADVCSNRYVENQTTPEDLEGKENGHADSAPLGTPKSTHTDAGQHCSADMDNMKGKYPEHVSEDDVIQSADGTGHWSTQAGAADSPSGCEDPLDSANVDTEHTTDHTYSSATYLQDQGVSSSSQASNISIGGRTRTQNHSSISSNKDLVPDSPSENLQTGCNFPLTGINSCTLEVFIQDTKTSGQLQTVRDKLFEIEKEWQCSRAIANTANQIGACEIAVQNHLPVSITETNPFCPSVMTVQAGSKSDQDSSCQFSNVTSVPDSVTSFLSQVKSAWTAQFNMTRSFLGSTMHGQCLSEMLHGSLDLLAAVLVGAYSTRCTPVSLLETLYSHPHHLEEITPLHAEVDPDAKYNIGNYTLSGRDINRLEGSSWLDDSVIHSYLHLLTVKYKQQYGGKVFVLECFLATLWENHNYTEWLFQKEHLIDYDWIMMPVCRSSHWALMAANVKDRAISVIDSRPSVHRQTSLVHHWMKYMQCRSDQTGEDLCVWQESHCPVFPQTDGSSCGVFVLMCAEALLSGVHPAVMRNYHVNGYRQYIKSRLMSAVQVAEDISLMEDMEGAPLTVREVVQVSEDIHLVEDKEGAPPTAGEVVQVSKDIHLVEDMEGAPPTAGEVVQMSEDIHLVEDMEGAPPTAGEVVQVSKDIHLVEDMEGAPPTAGQVVQMSEDIHLVEDMEGAPPTAGEVVQVSKDIHLVEDMEGAPPTAGEVVQVAEDIHLVEDMEGAPPTAGEVVQMSEDIHLVEDMEGAPPTAGEVMQVCEDIHLVEDMEGAPLIAGEVVQMSEDIHLVEDMEGAPPTAGEVCPVDSERQGRRLATEVGQLINISVVTPTSTTAPVLCAATDVESMTEELRSASKEETTSENVKSNDSQRSSSKDVIVLDTESAHAQGAGSADTQSPLLDPDLQPSADLKSQCQMLFQKHKIHFAALTVVCLQDGKLSMSHVEEASENSLLKTHMMWASTLSGADSIKLNNMFTTSLHHMRGNLLTESDGIFTLQNIYAITIVTAILTDHSADYMDIIDIMFLYRHVRLLDEHSASCEKFVICLSRFQQRLLMKRFSHEILQHRFAFVLSHEACGSHSFCVRLLKEVQSGMEEDTLKDLVQTSDRIHGCSFSHWLSMGKHLELYRSVAVFLSDSDTCECMIGCCLTGNAALLELILQTMDSEVANSALPKCRYLPVIAEPSDIKILDTHLLPPLHLACYYGNRTVVSILTEHNFEINKQVSGGKEDGAIPAESTPISVASLQGHTSTVELLLKHGANVEVVDVNYNTPLHIACIQRHRDIVTTMVAACRGIMSERNIDGNTPIHLVCQTGDINIVEILLNLDCDCSLLNYGNYLPLDIACEQGDEGVVKALLHKWGYPVPYDGSDTPLHKACRAGFPWIVQLLLMYDAERSVNVDAGHPLLIAIKQNRPCIASMLMTKKTSMLVLDGYGNTVLWSACKGGHVEIVKLLVENGLDVSQSDYDNTALESACEGGDVEIVKLLLENGLDVSPSYYGGRALCSACKGGHVEIVKLLLENGQDVSHSYYGNRALESACEGGHVEIVKLLLENGLDVSQYDCCGRALEIACEGGHVEIVKLLVENGLDVSQYDCCGRALEIACEGGHVEIVKLLVENGLDVSQYDYGDTALEIACEGGHVKIVKLLVENGLDVSQPDYGDTALEIACEGGHVEIVKLLLENGLDVSQYGYAGRALEIACEGGHVEIVKLLVENGLDVSQYDYGYYLWSGFKEGHVEIVKLLMENGLDVSQSYYGGRALESACEGGHVKIVKLLLENGLDVSQSDYGGRALESACEGGHVKIVKLLLENGRDVSQYDYGYYLWRACKGGHVEIVKLLMENGLDVSQPDYGNTALESACKGGHVEIVKLLVENGLDVSQYDYGGRALESACKGGHVEIVKLLVENGLDVSQYDYGGRALESAFKGGHVEIVKLLIENGLDVSQSDYGGRALEIACEGGHVEIVKLLVENGLDVSQSDYGYTALLSACEGGHVEIVKLLLENRLDVPQSDHGVSVLGSACEGGHVEIVKLLLKLLLKKCVDVSFTFKVLLRVCANRQTDIFRCFVDRMETEQRLCDIFSQQDEDGNTVIHYCCVTGSRDEILMLLTKVPFSVFNMVNVNGDTPLDLAVKHGHIHIVRDLITFTEISYAAPKLFKMAIRLGDAHTVMLLSKRSVGKIIGNNWNKEELMKLLKDVANEGSFAIYQILSNMLQKALNTKKLESWCPSVHICKDLIQNGCCASDDVMTKLLGMKNALLLDMLIDVGYLRTSNTIHSTKAMDIACKLGLANIVEKIALFGVPVICQNNPGQMFLHTACRYGHDNITSLLINKGAEVNQADDSLNTPLHIACRNGNISNIRILLEASAHVNARDTNGATPLLLACKLRHSKVVKLLMDVGADVSTSNDAGETCLHLCCERGKLSLVEMLLDAGAPVDSKGPNDITPLLIASKHGYTDIVKTLVRHGAKVSNIDINANSCLHHFCRLGKTETVKFLLDAGGNASIANKVEMTCFHIACLMNHLQLVDMLQGYAPAITYNQSQQFQIMSKSCKRGQDSIVDLLVKNGWNPSITNGKNETPLHMACKYRQTLVLRVLLRHNANVFAKSDTGDIPFTSILACPRMFKVFCQVYPDVSMCDDERNSVLHQACMKGLQECVGILCERGARVDIKNSLGYYPVHVAAENNNAPILKTLLKYNADISVKDNENQTPLHHACDEGRTESVSMLIEAGADIDARDSHSSTPLHLACRNGHLPVVQFLTENNADINHLDNQHNSGLCIACENGHADIASYLFGKGVSIHIKGHRGNTPLHRACSQGHATIVEQLLLNGADPLVENTNGNIPLYHAVLWGHVKVIRVLLDKCLPLFQLHVKGHRFLKEACARGHLDVIQDLLDHGAGASLQQCDMRPLVNAALETNRLECLIKIVKDVLDDADVNGKTILHILCESDNTPLDWIKKVVECGSNVCPPSSKDGKLPQHICSENGREDILHFILDKGGDKLAKDNAGWTVLHYACVNGNFVLAEWLIKDGFDINIQDNSGNSPLDLAILNSRYEITCLFDLSYICTQHNAHLNSHSVRHICCENQVEFLSLCLKCRVMFNCDLTGNSLLHVACDEGKPEIVQLLTSAGWFPCETNAIGETPVHLGCGDPNILAVIFNTVLDRQLSKKMMMTQDTDGNTPLHVATYERCSENVALLLERGADVNIVNMHKQTVLHVACQCGDENIVALFLSAKADICALDAHGDTPLHTACQEGHINVLKLLLLHGGMLDCVNKQGQTVLHIACASGQPSLPDILEVVADKDALKRALCVKDWEGNTPIHVAAGVNWSEDMNHLVKVADVSMRNNVNQTALHIACTEGNKAAVHCLLRAGSNVAETYLIGDTPLHIVCHNGCLDLVKMVIQHGGDTEAVNKAGRTPLHEAAFCGHVDVVKYLSECGCDIKALDNTGNSVLHLACKSGSSGTVEMCLAEKVKPNIYGNTPLHVAAGSSNKDVVTMILLKGYNVNAANKHGETPLFFACYHGRTITATELLRSGAEMDVSNTEGYTPLHMASLMGHLDTVLLLLAFKPNLEVRSCSGSTPLHLACQGGSVGAADALLKAGARVDSVDRDLNTPLHIASDNSSEDMISLLARWDVSAGPKNVLGDTPLHVVCKRGFEHMIISVLKLTCDILHENKEGKTPLQLVCEKGFTHILEILLNRLWVCQNLKQPNLQKDLTKCNHKLYFSRYLHMACEGKHCGIVKHLLQHNADVNHKGKTGDTPLVTACRVEAPDIVKLLVECGADILFQDKDGLSPLHITCRKGNKDIVNVLLEKGANFGVMDKHGRSPLFEAVENAHLEIVSLLIALGANVRLQNRYYRTPLHEACWEGHTECVRMLMRAGAELDVPNRYGNTPLHNACMQRHREVVDVLLQGGAEVSPVNKRNMTPLHYACLLGLAGTVDLLVKAGADGNFTDSKGRTPVDMCSRQDLVTILTNRHAANSGRKRTSGKVCDGDLPPSKRRRFQDSLDKSKDQTDKNEEMELLSWSLLTGHCHYL